jgi:hypothetical protein
VSKLLSLDELFKGRHFDAEIIVLCVRWYLQYKLRRFEQSCCTDHAEISPT